MDYHFVAFLVTAFLMSLTPGPAMLFVLTQAQQRGIKVGFSALLGVEAGVLVYVILTIFGLSYLFIQFPLLYGVLQILGAFYLLFLAFQSWPQNKDIEKTGRTGIGKSFTEKEPGIKKPFFRFALFGANRNRHMIGGSIQEETETQKAYTFDKQIFSKGLLVNLTNPKIGLFFLSLMPQFVPPDTKNGGLVFLVYGLLFNLAGLFVNGSVILFSQKIGGWMMRRKSFAYIPSILFFLISLKVFMEFFIKILSP